MNGLVAFDCIEAVLKCALLGCFALSYLYQRISSSTYSEVSVAGIRSQGPP